MPISLLSILKWKILKTFRAIYRHTLNNRPRNVKLLVDLRNNSGLLSSTARRQDGMGMRQCCMYIVYCIKPACQAIKMPSVSINPLLGFHWFKTPQVLRYNENTAGTQTDVVKSITTAPLAYKHSNENGIIYYHFSVKPNRTETQFTRKPHEFTRC